MTIYKHKTNKRLYTITYHKATQTKTRLIAEPYRHKGKKITYYPTDEKMTPLQIINQNFIKAGQIKIF
jgi:hypothetical protein